MALRLVQAGQGDVRDLVVVYFLASVNDAAVCAAAPQAVILNDTRADPAIYGVFGTEGILSLDAVKAEARRMTAGDFQICSVVLVGYSAGCKALRTQVRRGGCIIDALVAIDGTHASFPKPNDVTEIEPWRGFAALARAGRRVFVATHSMLTYTEKLPNPFMCTWNVLRLVTGWPLDKQGPPNAPVTRQDGNLAVQSYNTADAAGHRFQGNTVLPLALKLAMTLLWTQRQQANPNAQSNASDPWRDPTLSLGQRTVLWAEAQRLAGQCEAPPGSNSGPFVQACLAPCVRNGKLLGLTAGNWCAAFACAAEQYARLEQDQPPIHEYRASGFELEQDAIASGWWHSIDEWRSGKAEPARGDIVLLKRGAQAWQRHVVRFAAGDAATGAFVTIGGNEGGTVKRTEQHLSDPQLHGFIEMPHHAPVLVDAQLQAHDLSDEVMAINGDDIAAIIARLDARDDGDQAK